MKIGFFGDGPWAHDTLEGILTNEVYSLSYVVARYPNPDPVLKEKSHAYGLPFYCVKNVNSAEFLDELKSYKVDINVSMSFDQIIRAELRDSAEKGFLNCHAGGLPFYRGRNIINWALINGEKRLGITVHYIDDGIDTGDIVTQSFIAIRDEDNYGSVLEKATVKCSEAVLKALYLVLRNEVKVVKQTDIHPLGTYFGTRTWGDEWIDWNWASKRIHNFVRGITLPGPGARTTYRGKQIAILESSCDPASVDYIAKEGQVVGRERDWAFVKSGDNIIRVRKLYEVLDDGSLGKELNRLPRVGEHLGRNVLVEIDDLTERLTLIEERIGLTEKP